MSFLTCQFFSPYFLLHCLFEDSIFPGFISFFLSALEGSFLPTFFCASGIRTHYLSLMLRLWVLNSPIHSQNIKINVFVGPSHWNGACLNVGTQSPIDIDPKATTHMDLGRIGFTHDYKKKIVGHFLNDGASSMYCVFDVLLMIEK